MGRPLPQDDTAIPTPYPAMDQLFTVRERPSTFESTFRRMASRSSPIIGPSNVFSTTSRTDEMDLLRQVRSNNLSIPNPTPTQTSFSQSQSQHIYINRPENLERYMNWVPSGNFSQDRTHYNHIHHHQHQHQQRQQQIQSHHQQSQHHQQPQQNKQNDLFTYKPLYHPPPTSSYIYRPDPKPNPRPAISSTPSSADIHPRDRNFSPTTAPALAASPCGLDGPSPTELPLGGFGPLAMELPHGDWRRKYVGRGRGQSGG